MTSTTPTSPWEPCYAMMLQAHAAPDKEKVGTDSSHLPSQSPPQHGMAAWILIPLARKEVHDCDCAPQGTGGHVFTAPTPRSATKERTEGE